MSIENIREFENFFNPFSKSQVRVLKQNRYVLYSIRIISKIHTQTTYVQFQCYNNPLLAFSMFEDVRVVRDNRKHSYLFHYHIRKYLIQQKFGKYHKLKLSYSSLFSLLIR